MDQIFEKSEEQQKMAIIFTFQPIEAVLISCQHVQNLHVIIQNYVVCVCLAVAIAFRKKMKLKKELILIGIRVTVLTRQSLSLYKDESISGLVDLFQSFFNSWPSADKQVMGFDPLMNGEKAGVIRESVIQRDHKEKGRENGIFGIDQVN